MDKEWTKFGTFHNSDGINVTNSINSFTEQRSQQRTNANPWEANSYSIVGMDITKVEGAISSIDDYVSRIENKAREINEKADMNVAFKSDVVQTSVRAYVEKVEEYCVNLCSQLLNFRDRLKMAKEAWELHMQEFSENISSSTNSFDTYSRME